MNAECSKCLRGALTEANIAQAVRVGDIQDIVNRIRNIMPGKVVEAVIPKLDRIRVVMNRLLGILVSSVIAQPYVEAYL